MGTSRFWLHTVRRSSFALYRKRDKQPECTINFCPVLPAVLRTALAVPYPGAQCRWVPVCGGRGALWDSRAICVSYEVGEGFVGVGEHLVKIVIWF